MNDMAEHVFRPDQCLETLAGTTAAFVCTLPLGHEGNHNGEAVVMGERNTWLPGATPRYRVVNSAHLGKSLDKLYIGCTLST